MTLVNRKLIKLNDRGDRSATAFGSVSGGSFTFIKKLTASSSATVDFVDGTSDVVLDSTYKEYLFYFVNIHPATNSVAIHFQGSTDGGSSYGVALTSTLFNAYHNEGDSATSVGYQTAEDLAQSTSYQMFQGNTGADNDQAGSGYLYIFNPSSTTFVKNFISRFNGAHPSDNSMSIFSAGYFNTTSAIDAIQFKMSSGNMDSGDIFLHGLTI